MTSFNPRWVACAFFIMVGLVWSGGHVAWLVLLGVWVIVGLLGDAAP